MEWWRTDLVDDYGGGDLMLRVAPRTHKWAALEAAREAAILVDRAARQRMADSDSVRTLFFWGFEIDEKIQERIRDLKWAGEAPEEVLPLPCALDSNFDRAGFQKVLESIAPPTPHTVLTTGREIKGAMPQDLGEAARMLMGAFLPLTDELEEWESGKAVWFSTVKAFKGLEADILVLIEASDFHPVYFSRQDLYVAASRAKHRLAVFTSSDEVAGFLRASALN